MSGLYRELFPQLIFKNYNSDYEDKTIENIRYGNYNFNPIKPIPLVIDFEIKPDFINLNEEIVIDKSYPTNVYINSPNIKNYENLKTKPKIQLEEYITTVKNHLRKNDSNYFIKRLIINPVEYKIKITPRKYICRASYKLANINYVFGIMKNDNNFVDLCGGPGGFAEYILDSYEKSSGIGITLKTNNASLDWKIDYFRPNIDRSRFVKTYGKTYMTGPNLDILNDGTGDITDINNINSLTEQVLKCNPKGVYLVTADGAGFDEEEQELDSIELFQFKLFIAETFAATQILMKGGNFVLKIFKTKYACTQTFLMILASLFEESYIFKPITSRAGNSERYFIGKGFKYTPDDKIFYEFYKKCLEINDISNYIFLDIDKISDSVLKYFYDTSLENLQRQFIFCELYQSKNNYNWNNYISLKKLWTLLLKK